MYTKLKQHYSLFPFQNYVNYSHLTENPQTAEYSVTAIILDTAQYRLFRPVRSDLLLSTDAEIHFIKLDFINKGNDAVNLPSFLRSKSVAETVSTYFKDKESPIISYTHTKANKISLFHQHFQTSIIKFYNNPSQCECNDSSHLYQPYGHVSALVI